MGIGRAIRRAPSTHRRRRALDVVCERRNERRKGKPNKQKRTVLWSKELDVHLLHTVINKGHFVVAHQSTQQASVRCNNPEKNRRKKEDKKRSNAHSFMTSCSMRRLGEAISSGQMQERQTKENKGTRENNEPRASKETRRDARSFCPRGAFSSPEGSQQSSDVIRMQARRSIYGTRMDSSWYTDKRTRNKKDMCVHHWLGRTVYFAVAK